MRDSDSLSGRSLFRSIATAQCFAVAELIKSSFLILRVVNLLLHRAQFDNFKKFKLCSVRYGLILRHCVDETDYSIYRVPFFYKLLELMAQWM